MCSLAQFRLADPRLFPAAGLTASGLAAVDVQDLPSDVGRGLQEQDAVDDVADLADAAERGKLVTEPEEPAQPEYSLYVDLARTVDGEASTIAIAVRRPLPLATDDRKARRVCAELHLPEPSRTLGILHSYADAASLPQTRLREIPVKVRNGASFQPPRNDPDQKWWQTSLTT